VGILLFQDLAVIPFLILVAGPAGTTDAMPLLVVLAALAKGVLALLLILALGKKA